MVTTAGTGTSTTAGTGASTAGTGGDVMVAGTGGTAGTGTAGTGTGTAGTGTAGTGGAPGGDNSCLKDITTYNADGPFKFMAKTSGSVKMWVPMVPPGCKIPVTHLANGTGASCGSYQPVLNRLATHGFLSTCYENPNTGAGTQGVMALDTAIKMHPDLVDKKIGSTGHSQGGQATFTVLQQAEEKFGPDYIYAGLAQEPASGFGSQPTGGWQNMYMKIKSPMFMFSGTADMLVPEAWVRQGYTALADNIEAYWWSAVGATHIPVPNGATNSVIIAWFRWKLLGDSKACEYFKKLPEGNQWDPRMMQNEKGCN